jgi:hypothetical protein
MKLSKRQIRRIIREEKHRLISEAMPPSQQPQMYFVSDGIHSAVVPKMWLSTHPDDLDAELQTNLDNAKADVFYEGSHSLRKAEGPMGLEEIFFAANTLYALMDDGYLVNDDKLLASIFL